jgi:hypothetical protein
MEKYGVEDNDLVNSLRDEEHQLMVKVAAYMSSPAKTASAEQEYRMIENRLTAVRDKITQIDLKNAEKPG